MSINVVINSPSAVLLNSSADSVSIPSIDGEVTVSLDRRALMTALRTGIIYIFQNGKVSKFFVLKGIARFNDNTLYIATLDLLDVASVSGKVADFTQNPSSRPAMIKDDVNFNAFVEHINNPIY